MYAQPSPIGEDEERRCPPVDAPLLVRVTAKFHDPAIRFTYHRTYHSSPSWEPSEPLCRALVHRVEHCCNELITRNDSDALNATPSGCLRKGPKPIRFELRFEVSRQGHSGVWADSSFTSYQKQALTSSSAKEVLRSTHSIVGMFLTRHDKAFEWTDDPAQDDVPDEPETFKPSLRGPSDLACVPRAYFLEARQTWEFVPGFSLELTFHSHNPDRPRPDISRVVKVDSQQDAPLNLGLAEDLLWQAQRSVQHVLDQRKRSFDLAHANCDGLEGLSDCDCQHYDENALTVGLRVVNNLGPVYDHLCRNSQSSSSSSSLRLFTHPNGQDCDEFLASTQAQLQQCRDRSDSKISKLNDFDFRIAELQGHSWQLKNCARFTIDSRQRHSRPRIQALLDRIRTGVSDVLRGKDVAIRMMAYKRGHLVLDKALVARNHKPAPCHATLDPPDYQPHLMLAELRRRVQQDIDMICQDTCEVDDRLALKSVSNAGLRPRLANTPAVRACTPWDTPSPRSAGSITPSRAFPLVPTKWENRTVLAAKQTASGLRWPGGKRDSAMDLEIPFAVSRCVCDSHARIVDRGNLEPAAEVYPLSQYDTDASSMHSSMPALTESDSPSPDQGMLITPICGPSSSPLRRPPSMDDFPSPTFSNPFMPGDTLAAPSSTTFSDLGPLEDPKAGLLHREGTLPTSRPMTPRPPAVHGLGLLGNTPVAAEDPSVDEKTPLAPRPVEEPADEKVDNCKLVSASSLEAKHATTGTEGLEAVLPDLPRQSWLLYSIEEEGAFFRLPHDAPDALGGPGGIGECGPSETWRPSRFLSLDSLLGSQEEKPHTVYVQPAAHDTQTGAVLAEKPELSADTDSAKTLRQRAVDHGWSQDSSRSSEMEKEPFGQSAGAKTGHAMIPFSDSGVAIRAGSEMTDESAFPFEDKHVLPSTDEGGLGSCGPDPGATELIDSERPEQIGPTDANNIVVEVGEGPERVREDCGAASDLPVPASKPALASTERPNVRATSPRSLAHPPPPPPSHLGLGSAHLLPSLPLFSTLRSASHDPRPRWSRAASWDEYAAATRPSSDSVDTIDACPAAGAEEGATLPPPPPPPKRLGTPTAGLLGLNGSCWAERGIRTAFTGTDPFDRPPCAVTGPPNPSDRDHDAEAKRGLPNRWSVASQQRTSDVPRLKKSMGALLGASQSTRKQGKETRAGPTSLGKTEASSRTSGTSRADEADATRFPTTFILVAGLAFASSIVSRDRS